MKRLPIIILTFVLALSGALAAESRIVFESTEVDFGEIDTGKVVDLTFKFKNAGDETLIITSINSSCGCTVPKIEKKEYQPGEKGVIPVKFNSKGLSGSVVKTVVVFTNDKNNLNTTLKIKGTVVLKDFATIQLEPEHVDFAVVEAGKEYSRDIKIKNSGTIDLKVLEVTHSPQVYLLFDKDVVEPGGEIVFKVVFTPKQLGRFASFMRLRTNAHRQGLKIIKVSAEVKK